MDESLPSAQQRVKVLAEIMRLRRACSNPKLVLPDTPIESSKMEAFIEILQELRDNRLEGSEMSGKMSMEEMISLLQEVGAG